MISVFILVSDFFDKPKVNEEKETDHKKGYTIMIIMLPLRAEEIFYVVVTLGNVLVSISSCGGCKYFLSVALAQPRKPFQRVSLMIQSWMQRYTGKYLLHCSQFKGNSFPSHTHTSSPPHIQARKVEYKDRMEEEWEMFQKSIQKESNVRAHGL